MELHSGCYFEHAKYDCRYDWLCFCHSWFDLERQDFYCNWIDRNIRLLFYMQLSVVNWNYKVVHNLNIYCHFPQFKRNSLENIEMRLKLKPSGRFNPTKELNSMIQRGPDTFTLLANTFTFKQNNCSRTVKLILKLMN